MKATANTGRANWVAWVIVLVAIACIIVMQHAHYARLFAHGAGWPNG